MKQQQARSSCGCEGGSGWSPTRGEGYVGPPCGHPVSPGLAAPSAGEVWLLHIPRLAGGMKERPLCSEASWCTCASCCLRGVWPPMPGSPWKPGCVNSERSALWRGDGPLNGWWSCIALHPTPSKLFHAPSCPTTTTKKKTVATGLETAFSF